MYEPNKTPRMARRYKVDIFIPLLNLAIEIDGEHHYKVIAYDKDLEKAQSKLERRRMLDRRKDYYASLLGWELVRIRASDTLEQDVIDAVTRRMEAIT